MNFSNALEYLRAGARVTRAEWSPGNFLSVRYMSEAFPIIELYTDNGTARITWQPTQRELFADDWMPAPKPQPQSLVVSGMNVHGPMGGN